MKFLMCGVCILGALELSCASESTEPDVPPPEETRIAPTMCEPLRGVYSVTYARKNGNCAELPVQLAQFKDDTTMSALSSDCDGSVETSDNGCDRIEDGDCDVIDDVGTLIGSAHLSSMFTQTSDIRIEGSIAMSIETDDGARCSGEYALIGDKVRDK